MSERTVQDMSVFERYLSLWVLLCIAAGVLIGVYMPSVPETLSRMEIAHVSIPIAILIWLMIYPMMMKVNFTSVLHRVKEPKGLAVTLIVNWLIKPLSMFALATLFFKGIFAIWIPEGLAAQYIAGAVLLGAAPCTAMVFVWSHLTKGDPSYTVIQVAINDLIILIAYVPIVALLLGLNDIFVPYSTLFLSIILFVVVPLVSGILTRTIITKRKGVPYFEEVFLPKFGPVTIIGLLLTLIIIFSFQGETIVSNTLHIVLIAVPLIIQTFLIFFIAYIWAKVWKIPHEIAAPAGMIGASNFFELSVAVAVSLFGLSSPAALATVVGVLVEVPVMLILVRIANGTRSRFTVLDEAPVIG